MENILENSKEFFENMTDEEFEKLLDDMGFNYTKVNRGEGGLTILNEQSSNKGESKNEII